MRYDCKYYSLFHAFVGNQGSGKNVNKIRKLIFKPYALAFNRLRLIYPCVLYSAPGFHLPRLLYC